MPDIADGSSRRTYANQGNLKNQPWGICFWHMPLSAGASGNPRYLCGVASSIGYGIYCRRNDDGSVALRRSADGAQNNVAGEVTSAAGAMKLGQYAFVAGDWDGTTGSNSMRLQVNDTLVTSSGSQFADVLEMTGDVTIMGRHTVSTLHAHGLGHKFLMIRRPFTVGELAELRYGRIPASILQSDYYLRVDLDANANGISNAGATVAPTSDGGITLSARVPADLPGLAVWVEAANANSDAGSTPATNAGTVQQVNSRIGLDQHLSQATAANRPGFLSGADGGHVRLTLGCPTEVDDMGDTDAHYLANSSAAGPFFDPRSFTVFCVGRQRAMQKFGASNYDSHVCALGTTVGAATIGLAFRSGRVTVFGNNYAVARVGDMMSDASPNFFGACGDASSCYSFLGPTLRTISGGALPAQVTLGQGVTLSATTVQAMFVGDVIEFGVYQHRQDATNLATLANWYSEQYGWEVGPRAVLVDCEGSSSMYGQGGNPTGSTHNRDLIGSIPDENLNQWTIRNFATGGTSYSTHDGRFADTIGHADALNGLDAAAERVAVAFINVNDLPNVSSDDQAGADELIANYEDFYGKCRALGIRVVAVTISRPGSNETARDLYNAWLRDTDHKQGLFDLALEDPELPDGLHMSGAAMIAMGPVLRSAIVAALAWVAPEPGGGSGGHIAAVTTIDRSARVIRTLR